MNTDTPKQMIAFDYAKRISVPVPYCFLREFERLDPPATRWEIAYYGALPDPVAAVVKSRMEAQLKAYSAALAKKEYEDALAKPTFSQLNAVEGCVYFIKDEDGPIKIGYARHVGKRHLTLQSGNPRRLSILAAVPSNKGFEKSLHKQFSHARVMNEWYRPVPELLDMIEELTSYNSS